MAATFDTVALRAGRSPDAFDEMFLGRPQRQIVRVGVLDDSQSYNTDAYSRYLNYHAYLRHGNAPETPFCEIRSANYTSASNWLTATLKPDVVSQRTSTSRIPPGLSSMGYLSSHSGFMTVLEFNAYYAGEPTADYDIFTRRTAAPYYFNRGSDLSTAKIDADIFAATNASSGEVAWRASPIDGASGSFVFTDTATGTTALTLESGTFAVKKATVELPYAAGYGYMQFIVTGSHAVKYTDIMAVRLRSQVAPYGLVFTPLGVSGYQASHFAANHSDCGSALTQMGFDVFLHCYGTNDADNSRTAAQFKTATAANIDAINAFYDTASLRRPLHVLRADSYDTRLTGAKLTEANQYPGALAELAYERDDVLAINSRRVTDGRGWNAAGYTAYTVDGIHYSRRGGRVQAQVDEGLMCMREGDAKAFVVFPTSSTGTVGADVVADATWDELLAGHAAAGSAGKALTDASAPATAVSQTVEGNNITVSDST